MFQDIGECMTKETDGVGSIHDVLSRFFLGLLLTDPLYFSLLLSDCDALPTFHRAHMSHINKNNQIEKASRSKALSRVDTTSIEL